MRRRVHASQNSNKFLFLVGHLDGVVQSHNGNRLASICQSVICRLLSLRKPKRVKHDRGRGRSERRHRAGDGGERRLVPVDETRRPQRAEKIALMRRRVRVDVGETEELEKLDRYLRI